MVWKLSSFLAKTTVVIVIFLLCIHTWMFSQKGNLLKFPSFIHNFHKKNIKVVKPHKQLGLEQSDWQEVNGTHYHFNIYSAYHIMGRLPAEVLVIGTARTKTKQKMLCRIYFNDDHSETEDDVKRIPANYIQIPGNVETMQDTWGLPYAGVFIHCPFSGPMRPELVSILFPNQTKLAEPTNMVRIQNKQELGMAGADQHKFKFSLCVLPIFRYNETFRLIEWIEFYKMMGVEQITLYNVSIGPAASCILHDLMEGNDPLIKVNVLPWHKNPLKHKSLIRSGKCPECAISAGSNDCLYHHRGISKYMVFVDLDEFIMPRENIAKNYSQLIDHLDSTKPGQNIGHYSFRNAFFIRSRPDDPKLLERCSGFRKDPASYKVCRESIIMRKVWREKQLNSWGYRTKYIIKPEGVIQTGTHWANVFEPGYITLKVPPEIAYSRHYRFFKQGPTTKMDRVSKDFGNELVDNIAKKVKYFRKKCNISA